VQTTSGMVIGHASKWQPDVSEYLGIRFANNTLESGRRFEEPYPYYNEDGTVHATNSSKLCPWSTDVPLPAESFDEDCLKVNVWTKPQAGEKKKAVLFVLVGSADFSGSGVTDEYIDGSLMAKENDIVVVTAK
jgi:cholinesterase